MKSSSFERESKQNSMTKKKILFAGGGTGGHVFPALSIARELLDLHSNYEIEFVGTEQGFESKLVPQEGFKLWTLPVGKLNMEGQIWGKLKTLISLPLAFLHAVRILRKVKPEIVMGFGGYVSGPLVLTAALMGYRSVIWEPNAHPGLTNRWLSYFVDACFIVFDEAKQLLGSRKAMRVGLPVRRDIEELGESRDQRSSSQGAAARSGGRPLRVLVFGGSQGARAINRIILEFIEQNDLRSMNLEIIHQVGKIDFPTYSEKYKGHSQVQCFEFLSPMVKYYDWADLLICRSGASTVAEVIAARKPALFIPLPWAADDHQKKNALSLAEAGAAWMIEQRDFTPQSLKKIIEEMKNNPEKEAEILPLLRQKASPKAAQKTAQLLVDMIHQQG